MSLATWLTVVSICALGAMSPGPSLVVVVRHTLTGGRGPGVMAAVAHGLGIGIYALLCISGLAFLVTAIPPVFLALQWGGAAYLAWLGWKGLTARPGEGAELPQAAPTANAARDGFAIAFLNPKVAVFFIALFSQVIGPETTLWARLAYAATALVIDMGWYAIVAWALSTPRWLKRLQRQGFWFERVFGVILLGLAGRLVWQGLTG